MTSRTRLETKWAASVGTLERNLLSDLPLEGVYKRKASLQAAVRQAFASDWPVVPSDPLLGLYAAAFRKGLGEEESFVAEEQVSLLDALKASTIEGARLACLDDTLGSLR